MRCYTILFIYAMESVCWSMSVVAAFSPNSIHSKHDGYMHAFCSHSLSLYLPMSFVSPSLPPFIPQRRTFDQFVCVRACFFSGSECKFYYYLHQYYRL